MDVKTRVENRLARFGRAEAWAPRTWRAVCTSAARPSTRSKRDVRSQYRSCVESRARAGGHGRRAVLAPGRDPEIARISGRRSLKRQLRPRKGQPVRICQIGSRWVSVPVSASPYYMPEADGIIKRTGRTNGRADLVVFAKDEAAQKRLVLAGCDPATGLLSRMVEKISGVEIVSAAASSKLALTWLSEGKVHIAGSHLEDPKTGEFNLPFIRKQFPDEEFSVVTFARWEEGLVIAPGNPKGIRKIEDLARKNVRFVNREPGSGSRGVAGQTSGEGRNGRAEGPGIRPGRLRSSGGRVLAWFRGKRTSAWRPVPPRRPLAWISFRCTASATIW